MEKTNFLAGDPKEGISLLNSFREQEKWKAKPFATLFSIFCKERAIGVFFVELRRVVDGLEFVWELLVSKLAK